MIGDPVLPTDFADGLVALLGFLEDGDDLRLREAFLLHGKPPVYSGRF